EERGDRRPPTVVFVWGKAWRIPGVVLSVAEKLEHFTPEGLPRRSWLRMKFRRVDAGSPVTPAAPPPAFPDLEPPEVPLLGPEPFPIPMEDDSEDVLVHEVVGGGTGYEQGRSGFGERLDELAQRFCGDPAQWRLLASFNGIDDPMRIPAGFLLRIPKPSGSGREA